MQIENMSATELSRELKKGSVSVAETVAHYQRQIREKDGKLQAFLTLAGDDLQTQIEEIQDGIQSGRYTGPLAGIPVAVKDNICTKGLRTTCASKMLENFIPTYDATVIQRLKDAGMIVLGKTNMDEFAMGSTSETSSFGITKNPWNPACVPGGSSGGSAVAVAVGMAPLALGSDTGGSVRQPASFCGIVGLLPTYGRVSRYGLVAYASSLDQIGPMGRTVADCRALYEAIAGFDEKDGTSVRRSVVCDGQRKTNTVGLDEVSEENRIHACVEGLKGMHIGIPKEMLQENMNPEVREAIKATAALLEAQGALVEEMSLPLTDYAVAAYYLLVCAEASSNLSRFDGVKYGSRMGKADGLHELYKKSRTEGLGEETKRRILLGSFVLSEGYYDAYYLKALKVRRLIKEEFEKTFAEYDCLLTPVAPGTAPKLSTSLQNPLQMYLGDVDTVAVNLAGLPSLSVPCGLDKKGLPIGVQFIGNAFCEETLFAVGEAYEALRGVFPMPGNVNSSGEPEGGKRKADVKDRNACVPEEGKAGV